MTGIGSEWPTAQLHGADLVSLLAKSAPGLCLVERVIDAPAVEAWSWLADLERSIPAFDRTVRRVDVVERRGPLVTMRVRSVGLPTLRFRCHLGSEHWVMTAPGRAYLVAAGVAPLGQARCLYRQVEGVPHRVGRLVRMLVNRHVAQDADRVKQLVEDRWASDPRQVD